MRRLGRFIGKHYLWIVPIAFFAFVFIFISIRGDTDLKPETYKLCFVLSCLVPIMIKADEEKHNYKPKKISEERRLAMYKKPPKDWLRDELQSGDIPLGVYDGKYVSVSLKEDGHWLLMGSTGSGKTSAFLANLLAINSGIGLFLIDPKNGELYKNFMLMGADDVRVFNPLDRFTCGYDMLYLLKENSTMQEIFDVVTPIIETLVPYTPELKDPTWVNLAQQYLIGTISYAISAGKRNIIDAIDWINSKDAREIIKEALANSPSGSLVRHKLHNFEKMPDETLYSVLAQADTGLAIFANENIRYALRDNPDKVSPLALENSQKFVCSIDITTAFTFRLLLKIIIDQVSRQVFMRRIERINEYDPIVICIEEMPIILEGGPINSLLLSAKEMRGYRCRLYCCMQNFESIMSSFSENQVIDLVSNCNLIVLDAGRSSKTSKLICDQFGDYYEKEVTKSFGTGKDNRSVHYSEKPVMTPAELNDLKDDCVILAQKSGPLRIRKNPWYKDRNLREIIDPIQRHNKTILEVRDLARK